MVGRYLDLVEFVAGGYLAEVNRRVLHPLGLALAVERDDVGHFHLLGVQDHRADPEGVYFGDVDRIAGKAAKVAAEEARRRPGREAALGFWIQPLPGDVECGTCGGTGTVGDEGEGCPDCCGG